MWFSCLALHTDLRRDTIRAHTSHYVFFDHVLYDRLRVDSTQVLLVPLHPVLQSDHLHILRHDDGRHHSQCATRYHLRQLFLLPLQSLLRILNHQACESTHPSPHLFSLDCILNISKLQVTSFNVGLESKP